MKLRVINYIVFFVFFFSYAFGENTLKDFFVKSDDTEEVEEISRETPDSFDECCTETACCVEEDCCVESCLPRECLNGFLLRGEYLFWSPWQDGLAIAGKGSTYPGEIKHACFDWMSGFRAGIGQQFCDNWAIEINYTYLRPCGKKSISDQEIFPIFMPSFTAGGLVFELVQPFAVASSAQSRFTSSTTKVHLDYNVIDFELRRNISFFPCFDFEVMGGLQGALIKESLENIFLGSLLITAEEDIDSPIEESLPAKVKEKQQWKFAGGGIKLGGKGTYRTCCGFLLYGGGRFNLLFGRYRNSYNRKVCDLVNAITIPEYITLFENYYTIKGKEHFNDFVSNFQLELGLGFEGRCCWLYYRIRVGYEIDYWLDLAQFRMGLTGKATQVALSPLDFDIHFSNTNVTTRVGQDIGLQGLVVSLELKF